MNHPEFSRREFIWRFMLGSVLGVSFLSVFRYLKISSTVDEKLDPVMLLKPEQMPLNGVKAFPAYQIWLIRNQSGFYALRSLCTHMGCPPIWKSEHNVFYCPCHGSIFNLQGERVRGPALYALERHRLFWGKGGQIMLDRQVVLRKERGEWDLPGALLPFPS